MRVRWDAVPWSGRLLLIYFAWSAAAAAWVRGVDEIGPIALDVLVVAAWAVADSRQAPGPPWRHLRPWLALALIPLAYWQADLQVLAPPHGSYEQAWIGLDVRLLRDWRLQDAIQAWGITVPLFLEIVYACVYAAPAVMLAVIQRRHDADAVERFLQSFLVGTLATYALLPLFPSSSPRLAFPGAVPPPFDTAVRRFNIWILQHLDIAASVFPSGHVTAAWSTALGVRRAIADRRWIVFGIFAFAVATTVATVYGRYHYAVDALAGMAIACGAQLLWRRERSAAIAVSARPLPQRE